MKQQLKETITYSPNEDVQVTVNNRPITDDNGRTFFEQSVVVKVKLGWKNEKLAFTGEDDLRAFLDEINIEDPQQVLPL